MASRNKTALQQTLVRRKAVPLLDATKTRSLARFVRVLRAHMPALVQEYDVQSLGIFGSYLHGEQRPHSDLDILVEFGAARGSYYKVFELQDKLSNLLGVKLDLVENQNLKPYIGKRILSEVVWLRRDGQDLPFRAPRRKRGGDSMAAKREYLDFMSDIVLAMNQVERITAGVSFDDFVLGEEKVLATSKAVENIGEAVKHIPVEVRKRYPEINWAGMRGMRNRLAHGYFAVHLPTLWEIATDYIPMDKPLIAGALEQELKRRKAHDEKQRNGEKGHGGSR